MQASIEPITTGLKVTLLTTGPTLLLTCQVTIFIPLAKLNRLFLETATSAHEVVIVFKLAGVMAFNENELYCFQRQDEVFSQSVPAAAALHVAVYFSNEPVEEVPRVVRGSVTVLLLFCI